MDCNSQIYVGDTFDRQWCFMESPIKEADLTGCVAAFGFSTIIGETKIFSASSTDGSGYITIPDPTNGTIVSKIPTNSWPPGRYICAIKIAWPDNSVKTYDVEQIQVFPRIVQ